MKSPHLPLSPLFRCLSPLEDIQSVGFFNRITALSDIELPVDVQGRLLNLGVKSTFDFYKILPKVKRRLDIHIKGKGK